MVEAHNAMIEDVTLIVKELYGTPAPTAADPTRRIGGLVAIFEKVETDVGYLRRKVENGGIRSKREWNRGEQAVAVALIGMAGVVTAAALTSISIMLGG